MTCQNGAYDMLEGLTHQKGLMTQQEDLVTHNKGLMTHQQGSITQ